MTATASPLVVVPAADLDAMIRAAVNAAVNAALDARERAPVPDLLDARAVAAMLGVHPRSVQKMTRHQGLPHLRLGKLLRYRRAEIDRWIRDRRT